MVTLAKCLRAVRLPCLEACRVSVLCSETICFWMDLTRIWIFSGPHCISFLLLLSQITTHLVVMTTQIYCLPFCRPDILWANMKVVAGSLPSRPEAPGEEVSRYSGFRQNSVPCICRTELPHFLAAVSWGLFPASGGSRPPFLHLQSQQWWIQSFPHFESL